MATKRALSFFRCLGGGLLVFMLAAAGSVLAADAQRDAAPQAESGAPAEDPRVAALLAELDRLRQQASETQNYNKLGALNDAARALSAQATTLSLELQGNIGVLQAQLDVLAQEPVAASSAAPQESASADAALADVLPQPPQARSADHAAMLEKALLRRAQLNREREMLEQQVAQLGALVNSAGTLSTQLGNLRRATMRTQLGLKSWSIAGGQFWSRLSYQGEDDRRRLADFAQDMKSTLQTAWRPPWRAGSLLMATLALVLAVFGRRALERGAAWLVRTRLPDGHLRRSFFAAATVLGTFVVFYVAAFLLVKVAGRHGAASDAVQGFFDALLPLAGFCAVVAGLGRAILSSHRPSWRMASMPDGVASALRHYPALLAWLLLLGALVETVVDVTGMSMAFTAFVAGISSLLVVLWFFALVSRASRARRALAAEDAAQQGRRWRLLQRASPLGLLRLLASVLVLAIVVALLGGYISLARFLSFELVWVGMVLLMTWLLLHLVGDVCNSLAAGQGSAGAYLRSLLGADDLQLSRMAVVLSAIGRLGVLALALLMLAKGSFGLSPGPEMVGKAAWLLGEEGLGRLNISLQSLFNAVVVVVAGIWILRRCVRWLQQEYFPATMVAEGIRASVLALCLNLGYVLVILAALSVLGLQWSKLAWIVSALSVGIGFGLQEIVKNFISGIILLTERPVKVGDLVSINGIEGDIRRINVRATEIQLSSDRSTVIVPNSTLLSSPVRNATMDNASGVVTLALVFPLDADMTLVCRLLLEVLSENTSVLDVPSPSVSVSQISRDGIALSATGYVSSPRMISRTRSNLLLAVLEAMRVHGIVFSTPTAIAIERMPPAQPVAGEAAKPPVS